jgi:hypothetical protein
MEKDRIEYYKRHCADMIPHDDPEYASKLTAMAKGMVEAENKLIDMMQKCKMEENLEDLDLDLNFSIF